MPLDRSEPPPGWERYTVTDEDGCPGLSLHVRRMGPSAVTVAEARAIEDRAGGSVPMVLASEYLPTLLASIRSARNRLRVEHVDGLGTVLQANVRNDDLHNWHWDWIQTLTESEARAWSVALGDGS